MSKGETLGEHLKKRGGTLSGAGEFLQIFYPLMEGLDALHSQGFIHRDIKPANIMVKPDGSPVLLDFGAATQTQSQTMTITQMLSAGYSPFEQYTSRAKQGPYTDIYALGATMYKAITGKKPDDASDRVYNDPYQSLLWYEDYISIYGRPILSAVDAALKMEPKQRPQSVQAWLRMLDGGKEETTPEKVPEKVPVSMPSQDWPQEEWEVEGSSWAKPKIKKEVWVGGLIAALILGAFIVIMTSVLRDEPVVEQVAQVEEVSALTEVPWEIEINTEASEAEDIPEIPEVAEALYTGAPETITATPETSAEEGDPAMAALEAAQALFKEGQRFPSDFFDRVDKDALKSLAESGYAEAQFLWGRAHDSSLGLLGNDGEAARWYRKAAEAGDARAQYMLAVMYAKGKGVAKNSNEAVKWGRRAADQGHPWAQYYLGRYYLYGIGVPQDRAIAKLWLNKAYENNDAKAKKAATDLWAKVLSAERGSGVSDIKGYLWSREYAQRCYSHCEKES